MAEIFSFNNSHEQQLVDTENSGSPTKESVRLFSSFSSSTEGLFQNETVNNDVPAITLRDLSILPLPTLDDHAFGKRKRCSDLGWTEITFMIFGLLSVAVVSAFTITWAIQATGSMYTFNIITTIHAVFCIYYTIHGIIAERPLELLLLVIGWIILMIYGTLISVPLSVGSVWVYVFLIFIWTFGPGNIILGCFHGRLYYESRYVIFRVVGANLFLQDAVHLLFRVLSLIVFDLQLELSATLLFALKYPTIEEAMVFALGFCLIIFSSSLAYFSVRFEERRLSVAYFAFSVIQPGYIIYGLYVAIARIREEDVSVCLPVTYVILVVTALCVRVLLVYTMYKVFKNFGIGVKDKVFFTPSELLGSHEITKPVYNTFLGTS